MMVLRSLLPTHGWMGHKGVLAQAPSLNFFFFIFFQSIHFRINNIEVSFLPLHSRVN